jgi:hypothetical protein
VESDGTMSGTVLIKDLTPKWAAPRRKSHERDGTLFFTAADGEWNRALEGDGTDAGNQSW